MALVCWTHLAFISLFLIFKNISKFYYLLSAWVLKISAVKIFKKLWEQEKGNFLSPKAALSATHCSHPPVSSEFWSRQVRLEFVIQNYKLEFCLEISTTWGVKEISFLSPPFWSPIACSSLHSLGCFYKLRGEWFNCCLLHKKISGTEKWISPSSAHDCQQAPWLCPCLGSNWLQELINGRQSRWEKSRKRHIEVGNDKRCSIGCIN